MNPEAIRIADLALAELRSVAFWNWKPEVKASQSNLRQIVAALRSSGGHRGYQFAAEILHALADKPEPCR